MKYNVTLFLSLSCVMLLAFGCNDDRMFGDDSAYGKNELTVKNVNILSGNSVWSTKSDAATVLDTDTVSVILCDTMKLTAQTEWLSGNSVTDSTSAQTKGTPMVDNSAIDVFKINLYNTKGVDFTSSATRTLDITATKVRNSYKCDPTFNWISETDKISLFSYFPIGNATNGLTEDPSGLKVKYVVPTDITAQPDFCTTMGEQNVINEYGVSNTRSFELYHRLTAIDFAINGWNVKVTNIEIKGVSFSGSYDLPTNSWSVDAIGSDSRQSGVLTPTWAPNDSYSSNPNWTNVTSKNGCLMMVPQVLTDAAEAVITYEGVNGNNDRGIIRAPLKSLTSGQWTMGVRVTYKIQLRTASIVKGTSFYIPWKAGWTSNAMSLYNYTDPNDRYTFEWSDSWCYAHQGNPKTGDVNGGYSSGWGLTPSMLNNGSLYFFAKSDNPSIYSNRTAYVTVKGLRTAAKTVQVTQGAKPYIAVSPNYGSIRGRGGKVGANLTTSGYGWTSISSLNGAWSSPGAGSNSSYVSISVPQNPSHLYSRSIEVVFKTTNDGSKLEFIDQTTFRVTQAPDRSIIPSSELGGWSGPHAKPSVGLQVSPKNEDGSEVLLQWKTSASLSTSGSKSELGYGKYNTYTIFGSQDNMPAVNYCHNMYPRGEWYLPSPYELMLIMNRQGQYLDSEYQFGNNQNYWASEQTSSLYAHACWLENGTAQHSSAFNKQKTQNVRCIRNI